MVRRILAAMNGKSNPAPFQIHSENRSRPAQHRRGYCRLYRASLRLSHNSASSGSVFKVKASGPLVSSRSSRSALQLSPAGTGGPSNRAALPPAAVGIARSAAHQHSFAVVSPHLSWALAWRSRVCSRTLAPNAPWCQWRHGVRRPASPPSYEREVSWRKSGLFWRTSGLFTTIYDSSNQATRLVCGCVLFMISSRTFPLKHCRIRCRSISLSG